MKKLLLSVSSLFFLSTINAQQLKNLTQYVNPLIGTQRMGHTYPGVTAPFGMVQVSPDTDTLLMLVNGKYNPDIYKYCAGYQYDDKSIVGFSHTHFSGTGHSDLGDILVMPTQGKLQLNPGTADDPLSGFRSAFDHKNEKASPGYYSVLLDDDKIQAEITATSRVALHQYTFSKDEPAHIILDLAAGIYNYEGKNVWTFVRVENDTLVTGYRQTNGWGRTRVVYFAIAFSKPIKQYGAKDFGKPMQYRGFWRFNSKENFPEQVGTQLRMNFDFDVKASEKIKMKVALSAVSTEGALLNMKKEIPGWDFGQVKKQTEQQWNKELNKIQIDANETVMKNFYTAMYHASLSPTEYMDVDGKYRGLDQNIHQAKGFTNYTTFSLWDTYRALHPLFNIIQTKRNSDMVQSMLAHYDQSVHHMLPIWSHHANENWCMSGYHSVAVIADAVAKHTKGFDINKALDACVATAKHSTYDGLNYYMEKGYVPDDKGGSSVSKTLEYAYDDWAIAQLAKIAGRKDIEAEFSKRAQSFNNVFDPSIGFMRPKLNDGTFRKNFDVLKTDGQGFIEGNAWNYSLFVPQDPNRLKELMGGDKKFITYLDSLFSMHLPDEFFAETEDITRDGIIGTYVHGNEPAHHAAYLYNWTSQPWKTQALIRLILNMQYKPTPDGLGGNDDCGQMSAWYIFSALGFYPVAPGSIAYSTGSPAINNAVINLENGKKFVIKTINQSDKNVYVEKIEWNGKRINSHSISHDMITAGGTLVFTMSDKPSAK